MDKICTCWRLGNTLPRGVKPPQTLESLKLAWDMDQELIEEQRQEISKLSQTINKLRQAATKV